MNATSLFLLSLLMCASPSGAADEPKAAQSAPADRLAHAKEAFGKKDYKTAAARLKTYADKGDAEAQYLTALCYQRGSQNLKADPAQAFGWMSKAAQNGYAQAQFDLGVLYYDGKGVEFSHKDAAEWFARAAEQGLPEAQFTYGFMFYRGRGVEQSYAKAEDWWLKAAKKGHGDSMLFIGSLYEHGEGHDIDDAKAMQWYILATDNDAELAKEFQYKLRNKLTKKEMAQVRKAVAQFKAENPKVR